MLSEVNLRAETKKHRLSDDFVALDLNNMLAIINAMAAKVYYFPGENRKLCHTSSFADEDSSYQSLTRKL